MPEAVVPPASPPMTPPGAAGLVQIMCDDRGATAVRVEVGGGVVVGAAP